MGTNFRYVCVFCELKVFPFFILANENRIIDTIKIGLIQCLLYDIQITEYKNGIKKNIYMQQVSK